METFIVIFHSEDYVVEHAQIVEAYTHGEADKWARMRMNDYYDYEVIESSIKQVA